MGIKLDSEGFEAILPTNIDAKETVIDLRDVVWVYPDGATAFYLLLKYRAMKALRTRVLLPLNSDIISYMERMNCFSNLDDSIEFEPDVAEYLEHAWHEHDTMHQLTPLKNKKAVPGLVDKFMVNIEDQREISDEEKKSLTSCMVELFQNMPDHANPKNPSVFTGYVSLQSYGKRERVYLSIGDLGVGIRRSLIEREEYKLKRWNDWDAIEAVMNNRVSRFKDIDHSRGGGIRRAVESVMDLGGYILIRSGKGAVYKYPDGDYDKYTGLKFFPGTQIVILTSRFGRKK